jgi:hypothetical protein
MLAVLLCLVPAVPSGSQFAPAAVDRFLQRLTHLLSGLSETPLRTWSSGAEVFFESNALRLPAGELSFAGRLTVDAATGGFEGLLERFTVNGRQQLDLGRPALIRGAPDGTLRFERFAASGTAGTLEGDATLGPEGRVSALVRLREVDLHAIGLFFTSSPPVSGGLTADLNVDGTWESAAVRLAGRLDPGSGMPLVESATLQAQWASGSLEITACEGRLGGSPFRVSGRVDRLPDAPETGWTELAIRGDHLLLYRTDEMLLRGDVDLQLKGPVDRLELAGRVALTEGRYEGRLPLQAAGGRLAMAGGAPRRVELFALRSRPWRDAALNVHVVAAAPLQIVSPALRIAGRPDLRFTGTGGTPVATGRIDFEPGTLHLPGGRLEVASGLLRFQPPDPTRPTLEMIGSGRIQGYDVTAAAEGPLDEPRVTLSSYPVLGSEELLLLVLTGQNPRTPKSPETEKSRNINVAVALGKDMLSRVGGAGRTSETTQSVVERFDVEVGSNVTRTGDETVHVLFRVADGVVRPGDTLFLTGERDVWGYYNGGVRIAFRFP